MEIALDIVSWVFLVLGSFFSIVGGIGIVRFPEFFSRLHGGGITDTMGAGMLLIGLLFQAITAPLVAVKLMMILFFLIMTSPASCHALAKSAISQDVEPSLDSRKKR